MTTNFAKIGNPLTDGSFQVYIRYQYRNKNFDQKTVTEYIPTGYYLMPKDFEHLLNDKLSGEIYFKLMEFKKSFTLAVENYLNEKKIYPPKQLVLKQIANQEIDTDYYLGKYLESITENVKRSSYFTNKAMKETIQNCLTELSKISKINYQDVNNFVSETTTDNFKKYLINVKKFNNGYINTLMRLFVRMQNFARVELGLQPIIGNFTFKSTYKQYILNDEEIKILVDHKTKNNKLKEMQTILKINSLIGVRISEILSLESSNIHIKKNHIELNLFESKKNRTRVLPVTDKDAIKILKELKQTKTGKVFSTTKDLCNYRLKCLAKETNKFNDIVSTVKNVGTSTEIINRPKWDLISTHTIRKYTITKLAKKNLVLAQYFSGHSSLQTIQKHYLGEIDTKDALQMMQE